jgi:YebC/PmpR family DNA-binding regulatory protein
MAGHSHWAGIKHKKAIVDAKRGRLWSKLARGIIQAARHGGGDPDANLKLKYAIDKAKAANMPKDTIAKAVQRGTGELEGADLEEIVYEGYGPAGVAVMLEVLTDNRNRTVGEIRKLFEKRGGNMGNSGCVAWQFEQKTQIRIGKDVADEDTIMEAVLDAGVDDIEDIGDEWLVTGPVEAYQAAQAALEGAGIEYAGAEVGYVPTTLVPVADADTARKVLALMESLEDHDDIQNAYGNFDIPDEVLAEIEE